MFVPTLFSQNVKFDTFTLTRADTQITGVATLPPNAGTATSALGLNSSNQIVSYSAPSFSGVSVGYVPYESATDTFSNSLITQSGNTIAYNNFSVAPSTSVGYSGASFTAGTGIGSITYSAPTYTANSSASYQGIINLPALGTTFLNLPCLATFTNLSFPLFAVAPYPYFTLTSGATVVYTSAVGASGTINIPFTPTSSTLFITIYFKAPFTPFTGAVFTWNTFTMGVYTATMNGFLAVGTNAPTANFQSFGTASICGGTNFANLNNYMATGSLTIGDAARNYGGGAGWNSNTACLLLECQDNTEIAVHDAGTRVASLMYYTNANNMITMGRDMGSGWGTSNVATAGTFSVGTSTPASYYGSKKFMVLGTSASLNGSHVAYYNDADLYPLYQQLNYTHDNIFQGYDIYYDGTFRMSYTGYGYGFYKTGGLFKLKYGLGAVGTAVSMSDAITVDGSTGNVGIGVDPFYKFDVAGSMHVRSGDNSMCYYGANATWNAFLVVGSGTDKSGGATAQVISTNGNLHLDAGNSNDMYYGYYPNSRGAPNTHQFYGSTIVFNSGLPQQDITYAWPVVMNGSKLFRSQAIQKRQYMNNSVGWAGGVNIVNCFYKYNGYASVRISGKLSYYVGGATRAYPVVRTYHQATGTFTYWSIEAFTNNGFNHTTFPIEVVLGGADLSYQTGWFDVYVYNNGNCNTDTNDQLWINVEVLPSSEF
jgi:hypothetical protein